ncbi:hypothetical protein [Anaeroarcus burkinensis]|uniref:hypothetical protein n=1 Tax=Anaeroarcus burkinensis TaxID=82376 RepID=UPI00048A38D9|nr:hypothetical protein [Anaeroarcus burkinensis]
MSIEAIKKVEFLYDELKRSRKKRRSLLILPYIPALSQFILLAIDKTRNIIILLYEKSAAITEYPIELVTMILFFGIYMFIPFILYKIKYIEMEIERLEKKLNNLCQENIFMVQIHSNVSISPVFSSIFRSRPLFISLFLFCFLTVFYIVDIERARFWLICSFVFPCALAGFGIIAEKRAKTDYGKVSLNPQEDYRV